MFASKDWFRLAYCYSILLLYRHYLTCTAYRPANGHASSGCPIAHVESAFVECTARSREICLLYRRTYQRSPVRYTWGSLHILFLGGLTYLHCLWSSPAVWKSVRQVDVINTCTACTMVLVIIAERWSKAKIYRDVFEQLAEQTISFICGGTEMSDELDSIHAPGPAPRRNNIGSGSSIPGAWGDTHIEDWAFNLSTAHADESDPWFVQDFIKGFGDQADLTQYDDIG